ncbi:CheR family methyltransferase [Marinilabiliaceae bacterium ANBcel2]|nr:CheR family methyltransferase [Marinilabiliaceae bacterium ANBcel2]
MNLGINEIKEITKAMALYPEMDYSNFLISFLKRRLSLIFDKLKIRKVDLFIESLSDETVRRTITDYMCVEVTEMFRDPAFWRSIRSNILDKIPDKADTIWLPHISTGEELFSLSVILHESEKLSAFKIECNTPSKTKYSEIITGKINPKHFDLNQTNYKRLENKELFKDYFNSKNGEVSIKEELRNNIKCNVSNSFTNIDSEANVGLIIFRNIAIYLNHKTTEEIYKELIDKLMPGGFLAIGIKEELPQSIKDYLIEIDSSEKIYKKPQPKQSNSYA